MPSLADLLKEIEDPRPVELDPEDGFHSLDARVDPSFEEGDGIPVGVRRQNGGRVEEDGKYEGRKVSRREVMDGWQDGSGEEIESEGDVPDGAENSGASLEDEDVGMSQDEASVGAGDSEAFEAEEDEDAEMEDEDDGEQEDGAEEGDGDYPVANGADADDEEWKSYRANGFDGPAAAADTQQADGERALISQLKASAVADVEKGQAVRKQLALYNQLLGLRIRMQKVLTAANNIDVAALPLAPEEMRSKARGSVAELAEQTSTLRATLMELNEDLPRPDLKRKRESDDASSFTDAASLDSLLRPHVISTLSKWSSKVNAATLLSASRPKKGEVHVDAGRQLEQVWAAPLERARLAARTRVRRTGGGMREGGQAREEDDVFDDRDFYHSLLKEVVDSSAAAAEGLTVARPPRTRKQDVDRRASKGRKIRFNVHDKLVDFMVPQNEDDGRGGEWTDERRDELFAGLLGRGWEDAAPVRMVDEGGLGELRLFA